MTGMAIDDKMPVSPHPRSGDRFITVGPENEVQELYLPGKKDGEIERRGILPARFVPMTVANAGKEKAP